MGRVFLVGGSVGRSFGRSAGRICLSTMFLRLPPIKLDGVAVVHSPCELVYIVLLNRDKFNKRSRDLMYGSRFNPGSLE